MTQNEFKEAMFKGLGRCIRAVQHDPERYRELVIWACGHDLCFDAQCEGSRDWYVLQMVRQYPDCTAFVEAAASALVQCDLQDDWRLAHLCGLLAGFARAGNLLAKQALEEKYDAIYSLLENARIRNTPVFHERDALERLCVSLAVDEESCLKIAENLGRLYMSKDYLADGDFAWVYQTISVRWCRILRDRARNNPAIACFMAREEAWQQLQQTRHREALNPDKMEPRRRSVYLRAEGDRQTIGYYAEAYRTAVDPKERAEALLNFCCCPYPDDPAPILMDAKSEDKNLAWAALLALQHIRHPEVREFALMELGKAEQEEIIWSMLMQNSQPEDVPVWDSLLTQVLASNDRDRLHGLQWRILNAIDEGNSGLACELPLIYETIPCSCCRRKAVRLMGERGLLTEEMLSECLMDSDADTRQYARLYINRTANKCPLTTPFTGYYNVEAKAYPCAPGDARSGRTTSG